MTANQTKFILYGAAAVMSVCAVGVLAMGLSRPLEFPTPRPTSAVALDAPLNRSEPIEKELQTFARPLQQLDAAANEPAIMPATAPAEASLMLVGTIGESLALLRTSDGVVEVRAVGESLAGAEIISIAPARVEILQNGKRSTLIKPQVDG